MTKRTILLVDDDVDIVWGLQKYLQAVGYEVVPSLTADNAIAEMEAHQFDYIITDIIMPGINGLDLVEWTARNQPHTKIVVVSAIGPIAVRELSFEKGAHCFLAKPFDLVDLVMELRNLLPFN
jgi:DNA-binding NtrC family response regulator